MIRFYEKEKKANEIRYLRRGGELVVALLRKSIFYVLVSRNRKDRPETLINLLEYVNLVVLS